MKQDNFEEFVQDHRSSFDEKEPPAGLWDNIASELDEDEKDTTPVISLRERFGSPLGRIAAAILLVVSSILIYEQFDEEQIIAGTTEVVTDTVIVETLVLPELAEAEAFYGAKISAQMTQLTALDAQYPGISDEINGELEILGEEYNSLKSELNDDVANEEIIGAMIDNYKIRLEILEDILTSLETGEETYEDNETHDM